MSKNISVKVKLIGGKHITEANSHKIRVIGQKGGAKGVFTRRVDVETYTPNFRIVKEAQGWIAQEVNLGYGICGNSPTLRDQIIRILLSSRDYQIIVED